MKIAGYPILKRKEMSLCVGVRSYSKPQRNGRTKKLCSSQFLVFPKDDHCSKIID